LTEIFSQGYAANPEPNGNELLAKIKDLDGVWIAAMIGSGK
jgi:hypothetical protein